MAERVLLERAARRKRKKLRAYEDGDKGEACEVDGRDGEPAPARKRAQPALGEDRAHGEKHGIGGGHVVVAAFADARKAASGTRYIQASMR